MRRGPFHRCTTALLLVISLLFSQLVLAGYVCPAASGPESMQSMEARMAAGEPCKEAGPVQPVLCHQHATNAAQAVDPLKAATPSLPSLIQVLALPALDLSAEAQGLPLSAEPEVHPPPGPLFLSTLRFRV
jgi:hypothetical protein